MIVGIVLFATSVFLLSSVRLAIEFALMQAYWHFG
jgi:hypothetical protein